MSTEKFRITKADKSHREAVLALMPRLADFDLPATRNPRHLWEEDAAMFERWLEGQEECLVHVAVDPAQKVLGFSMVRLREELLSHEPSAHLEALAVAKAAEGMGVGKALLVTAENNAKALGAQSMTLHVFAVNTRARAVYERAGYGGELMRYIKHLDD
jgi:ribosomal protein S18 acetylase RimI-like enzyme